MALFYGFFVFFLVYKTVYNSSSKNSVNLQNHSNKLYELMNVKYKLLESMKSKIINELDKHPQSFF